MTHPTTILAGRHRRPVRVERKTGRRWTDAEIRGAGVAAVGDALFRMGGTMTGERLHGLLVRDRPKPARVTTRKPETSTEMAPVSPLAPPLSGALADDVCRHVHEGWFDKPLWFGGVL